MVFPVDGLLFSGPGVGNARVWEVVYDGGTEVIS